MIMRRERLLTLAVAACALTLCAGPVSAALTVEIIQPETDPFTTPAYEYVDFEAVAYLDSQEVPGGEVDWLWDFDDGITSEENPTDHAFENQGNYTVTVTATYGQYQDQDTITAQVGPPEDDALALKIYWNLTPRCHSGGTVCHDRFVAL